MNEPIILFRRALEEENELEIASRYIGVVEQRTEIPENRVVIGRYSCLPYYKELEKDVKNQGSRLINSYKQHKWIADFTYYEYVAQWTFESWRQHELPWCEYDGPFVVKGATNSKKNQWKKLMYAPTKADAVRIGCDLMQDGLISQQDLIYRKYEPLENFGESMISGLPYSNEWRFFFYGTTMLAGGFYWSNLEEEKWPLSDFENAKNFAAEVASTAAEHVNFYALDVAKKQNGDWVLVEINDGQMSGLSTIDPHDLYKALSTETKS